MFMDMRKNNEKDYHNKIFGENAGIKFRNEYYSDKRSKYYAVSEINEKFYHDFLSQRCEGKKILEYGSGLGETSFFLASKKAHVVGIDVSDVALERATHQAKKNGISNVSFKVMDAEATSFENGEFDIICSSGVLHHLNLRSAYTEIARLLKPDGFGIFIEPLGHNPAIELFRKLTPDLRTKDEHPFKVKDLKLASKYFDGLELHYFHLFTLLAIPFRKVGFVFAVLLKCLHLLDQFFFKIPWFRRYAWMVVIIVSKPKPLI